jgi:hypothetical protein
MATTWHVEGRVLPHERLRIRLRGQSRRAFVVLMLLYVPWLLGDQGASFGHQANCGRPHGTEPHVAWFRCTAHVVESQNMSDFPILHELSNVATDYHLAVERDDMGARLTLERHLLSMVKDESWKK